MKRSLLLLSICGMIASCKSTSPSDLARQACSCYTEAKSIQNPTKQLKKIDECFRLTQRNLEKLEQLGIDHDWNNEQVEKAKKEFDRIYDKCNGNSIDGEKEYSKINQEIAVSTPNEIKPKKNNPTLDKHDKLTIDREIKAIQKRFYSINYGKLKIDSLSSSSNFEADKTLVYSDENKNVVRISEIFQGANIKQETDYYFTNNTLYFIYNSTSPTNTNPNGYEKRTYIYENDIIKMIENGKQVPCTEDCDFSLQSNPYRLLRHYLGNNY